MSVLEVFTPNIQQKKHLNKPLLYFDRQTNMLYPYHTQLN